MKEIVLEEFLNPIETTVVIRGANCVFIFEDGIVNRSFSDRFVERPDLWQDIPVHILEFLSKEHDPEEWRTLILKDGPIFGLLKVTPPRFEDTETGKRQVSGVFNLLTWPPGSKGQSSTHFGFTDGEEPIITINSKGRASARKREVNSSV